MSDNLLGDLEKFKSAYYTENKKNVLFKKDQKMDMASKISTEFNLETLIQKTIYILPGTNEIYFDYNVFKMFAHPTNYATFISYTQMLIVHCIQKYGSFICHFNVNSFTASAAERYKGILELFNAITERDDTNYSPKMTKLHIYNTPSSFEHIYKLISGLIDPEVRSKIVFHSKAESTLLNPVK
jgi:hypothetical protein